MDMIEKIAKAIAPISMGPAATTHAREYAIERAIAALKAMREPSEEMINAGHIALLEGGESAHCWQAMIDTALAEGREG